MSLFSINITLSETTKTRILGGTMAAKDSFLTVNVDQGLRQFRALWSKWESKRSLSRGWEVGGRGNGSKHSLKTKSRNMPPRSCLLLTLKYRVFKTDVPSCEYHEGHDSKEEHLQGES